MTLTDQSPTLRRANAVRRTDALFQAMSQDYLLRQQFITNPVSVLSEYVYGTPIPAERAAASNQLIYAVLAERDLLSWLHVYASDHRNDVPSGRKFLTDISSAIVDYGGRHAVMALIRSSVEGNSLVEFDEDLLHYFFNLGVLVAGAEEQAAADTEAADDAEGLDVRYPATCTAITWKTWLITRPSMEVDERFSANQLSEFAPRYVMVTLDELAGYAAALRRSGALDLYPGIQ
jgi:hypothetical protein